MNLKASNFRNCLKISVISLFLIFSGIQSLRAVEVKYSFKTGFTYSYEYVSKHSTEFKAFQISGKKDSDKFSQEFEIKILSFDNNAYVADIISNGHSIRRYISPTGKLVGAPTETGQKIPFLLTFPTGDWKVGTTKKTSKNLKIGNKTFQMNWLLKLKDYSDETNLAEIVFSGLLDFPEDRIKQKNFDYKGKIKFDLTNGCINQADWLITYQFSFLNKELAVIRPMWEFAETHRYSLKLKGVREN